MAQPPQLDVSPGQQHIIERPRLLKLLDESDARIILLVAPAGYGKTTLARQWLRSQAAVAWCDARLSFGDPVSLAMQIARSARTTVPAVSRRAEDRAAATGAPVPDGPTLADLLMRDLEPWPRNGWICVDEHDVLTPEADALLGDLIDRSELRVLVTSRQRPPWADTRRLVYGEMILVPTSELAMTVTEARQLLGAEDDDFVSIASGWPALVALRARVAGPVSQTRVPAEIYDFLTAELLRRVSARLRDALPFMSLVPEV